MQVQLPTATTKAQTRGEQNASATSSEASGTQSFDPFGFIMDLTMLIQGCCQDGLTSEQAGGADLQGALDKVLADLPEGKCKDLLTSLKDLAPQAGQDGTQDGTQYSVDQILSIPWIKSFLANQGGSSLLGGSLANAVEGLQNGDAVQIPAAVETAISRTSADGDSEGQSFQVPVVTLQQAEIITIRPVIHESESSDSALDSAAAQQAIMGRVITIPATAASETATAGATSSANQILPQASQQPRVTPSVTTIEVPAATHQWSLAELSHSIRTALGSLDTLNASSGSGKQAATPASPGLLAANASTQAPSASAQAASTEGLPTADLTAGRQTSVRTAGAQPATEGTAPLAATDEQMPVDAAAPQKANQVLKSISPALVANAASADATTKKSEPVARQTSNDSASTDTTVAAAASATTSEKTQWAAQPIQDANGASRMPHLIEQVREVSDWMADRAEGAIRMGKDGVEANLRLYPPDLGNVRVNMTIQNDGTVQSQFLVEQPETARLIEQNVRQFTEGLARQGMQVGSVQVSVIPVARASADSGSNLMDSGQNQQSRREGSQSQQRSQDWSGQRERAYQERSLFQG